MRRFASTFFTLVLFAAQAAGQTVASEVNGTVKDEAGGVVAGAAVRLTDTATNREVSTVTNDEGFYLFANVRPGVYKLSVEQAGFKRNEVGDLKVDVGVPATLNMTLTPGGVDETVTVTSADAQSVINTTNAELSTTVQQRQINDLPLNGRNPIALAGLQAGVSSGGGTRSSTINGLRGTFSNLTWDGININDNFIRTDSLFGAAAPSVPGVAEFTLTTQNAGAGDGLGVAQVKLVTPRGTNKYHGSFFEFHRNDALDANSFFNNADGLPKPKLIRNQFGANVGGPFRLPRFGEGGASTYGEDKLFFYAYYEGTIEREDDEVNRTVLTQSARQGLFTYRRADNGQLQTVNLLTLGGLPVDPLAQQLINLTPLPNDLTGGDRLNFARFNFNSPAGSDSTLWGFRTDYELNDRHRFEVIYSRFKLNVPNDTFNDNDARFPGLPGAGQNPVRPRFSSAWNWTPTPSFNNELRLGFFKQAANFFTDATFDRGYQINFPGILTTPEQNFLRQGRNVATYEIIDNAGKSFGDHYFRFGGNYRRVDIQPYDDNGSIPQYTLGFNDIGTVNPLDDAQFPGGIATTDFTNASAILATLSGTLGAATQTFVARDHTSGFVSGQGELLNFRNFNIGTYFQDTWRVRPNLTLNLGVRHEFISVPVERNGLALLPRGGLESLLTNAPVEFASGGGRPLFKNDFNNFAPNFSFAYDPFGDGKTSLRGGYAISYVIDNNITTVLNAAVRGNDGLTTTINVGDIEGTLSGGGGPAPVQEPEFQVPTTARQNFINNPTSALFTIDPDLRTPYVQQWNLGVEREIFRDTVVEARYVGNRGVKLTRAIDINQMRIFNGGFFEDFQRAQFNIANCGGRVNPSAAQCANRQPLQLLPRFGAFALNQSTALTAIRQGEPARLLDFYIQNKDFFFSDFGGGDFGSSIPLSTFLPNPNTYVADYVGNGSYSNYNALQVELRRRFRDGIDFQANYTFSRAFTDYEGAQTNFQALLDLTLGSTVEKRRPANDITHIFKFNGGYELPFGPGKSYFANGFMSKLLGGIKLTGIGEIRTGRPFSIVSNRGTLNRVGRSNFNAANTTLSLEELQNLTGLFYHPVTGRPQLFDPSLINPATGRANSAFFSNPAAGTVGSLQLTPVEGPGFWNVDLGFIKRTPITETVNIEFRAEAFNVFNHTNFFIGTDAATGTIRQNINATTFGQITTTYAPRILQFAVKLNF